MRVAGIRENALKKGRKSIRRAYKTINSIIPNLSDFSQIKSMLKARLRASLLLPGKPVNCLFYWKSLLVLSTVRKTDLSPGGKERGLMFISEFGEPPASNLS